MGGAYFNGFVVVILLFATISPARADDWAAPQMREVFSASREYFVRVTPGASLGDTFGVAGEKKGKHAAAELYRRHSDRSYRLLTEFVLLNPVAPVEFFLSNEGRLATIDNWHNIGYGSVVSIYEPREKIVRSYELKISSRKMKSRFLVEAFRRFIGERDPYTSDRIKRRY